MKLASKSGASLAAAAAAFVMNASIPASIAVAAEDAMVHCVGVNACKGKNSCQGAGHACKGHGSCKGTGFVDTSATVCDQIGGKAEPIKM
jgi:hypothetical protein